MKVVPILWIVIIIIILVHAGRIDKESKYRERDALIEYGVGYVYQVCINEELEMQECIFAAQGWMQDQRGD